MNGVRRTKFLASSRILIISFLLIILIGTGLLMLPQATVGETLSFIDALFTATSATCVTGLVIADTGTKFTVFGQLVILALIQVGGLGIMTFSTFFVFLLMGKFSLSDRDIIQETFTQSPFKNVSGLLKYVFVLTIIIESIGALLLTACFAEQYSPGKSLYLGVFHSVAAFCNAGFSLFNDNLMGYVGDWRINVIIMLLIISGGIGFVILHEAKNILFSKRRTVFSFHSRVVFIVTAALIAGGALLIFLFERQNTHFNLPLHTQVMASFFQSVTCRTAGFNTMDISLMANASLVLMIFLMFIGASPGSCGGGIKTSTFGVLVALMAAQFKNSQDVNLLERRIPVDVISKVLSVSFFSVVILFLATTLLMISETSGAYSVQSRGLFLDALFEVVSAFGTVGLSAGLTFKLSTLGKLIIIITMFIGRLGPLTIVMAIGKKGSPGFRYAQEKVLIG
ncbi:MAG: TrkH family potassium uptake protein [Candidatus Zhuqueibacterota bacterium]